MDSTIGGRARANQIDHLLSLSALQPPPRCVECMQNSKVVVDIIITVLRVLAPVIAACYQVLYRIYSVTPANELMMIYGVALCFFGGRFCASIAAIECFRRTGGDKLLLCGRNLCANIQVAWEAHLRDEQVDQNNDGVADVLQISTHEWYKRKVGIVLKAVDPDILAQSLAGLYQGFLGMIMSLRFKFARTVALACSVADLLRKPVAFIATPILAVLMPKEYHKWINQMINFTLKAIAVHLAWKLQEVVSALQSGLMGGSLFATGLIITIARCSGRGKAFDPDTTYLDELLGLPLAAAGFWFQLQHGFALDFPYNLALFPLTFAEWFLRMCITWMPISEDTGLR